MRALALLLVFLCLFLTACAVTVEPADPVQHPQELPPVTSDSGQSYTAPVRETPREVPELDGIYQDAVDSLADLGSVLYDDTNEAQSASHFARGYCLLARVVDSLGSILFRGTETTDQSLARLSTSERAQELTPESPEVAAVIARARASRQEEFPE